MEEKRREGDKFIFPGERLGVIEEYLPGQGTYVEEGNIYSATTGYLSLDRINKEAQVHSQVRTPLIPREGSIVIGRVSSVSDKTMSINIFQIDDKIINTSFTGVMHISNTSQSYVKTMKDVFKAGDVVRSKVMSTMNREFHLTTQERELGVIQAACSRCGEQLIIRNRMLRCSSCRVSEGRKLASDYGEDP